MNKSDSLNPFMVSLMHLDNNNNKRFISFHSNKKKHGNEVYLSDFYYGEDVDIKGKLKSFRPKYVKLPESIKLVTLEGTVQWGKQTKAMYNIKFNIPTVITDSDFKRIQNVIKKYPYSYYLLSIIKENIPRFNNNQLQTILSEFSNSLRDNSDIIYIISIINSRNANSINTGRTMIAENDQLIQLFDTTTYL